MYRYTVLYFVVFVLRAPVTHSSSRFISFLYDHESFGRAYWQANAFARVRQLCITVWVILDYVYYDEEQRSATYVYARHVSWSIIH